MANFKYKMDESVAIVTMNSGENVFNLQFINEFLAILDEVEQLNDAHEAYGTYEIRKKI